MGLQNLGTTCEIWEKDLHLDAPKHTVQYFHSVQYYYAEDEYFPVHSLTIEVKFQFCGGKGHTATICDNSANNIIDR